MCPDFTINVLRSQLNTLFLRKARWCPSVIGILLYYYTDKQMRPFGRTLLRNFAKGMAKPSHSNFAIISTWEGICHPLMKMIKFTT